MESLPTLTYSINYFSEGKTFLFSVVMSSGSRSAAGSFNVTFLPGEGPKLSLVP